MKVLKNFQSILLICIYVGICGCNISSETTLEAPDFPDIQKERVDLSYFIQSNVTNSEEYLAFNSAKQQITFNFFSFALQNPSLVFLKADTVKPYRIGGNWIWEIKNTSFLGDSLATVNLTYSNNNWKASITSNTDIPGNFGLKGYPLFTLDILDSESKVINKEYPVISSSENNYWFGKISFISSFALKDESTFEFDLKQYQYPVFPAFNPESVDSFRHNYLENESFSSYELSRYNAVVPFFKILWDKDTGEGYYKSSDTFIVCWNSDKKTTPCENLSFTF